MCFYPHLIPSINKNRYQDYIGEELSRFGVNHTARAKIIKKVLKKLNRKHPLINNHRIVDELIEKQINRLFKKVLKTLA